MLFLLIPFIGAFAVHDYGTKPLFDRLPSSYKTSGAMHLGTSFLMQYFNMFWIQLYNMHNLYSPVNLIFNLTTKLTVNCGTDRSDKGDILPSIGSTVLATAWYWHTYLVALVQLFPVHWKLSNSCKYFKLVFILHPLLFYLCSNWNGCIKSLMTHYIQQ